MEFISMTTTKTNNLFEEFNTRKTIDICIKRMDQLRGKTPMNKFIVDGNFSQRIIEIYL